MNGSRLDSAVAGGLGALLVHAILLMPLFVTLSLPPVYQPHRSGPGASATGSNEDAAMTVVFINEPSPVEKLAPIAPEALASKGHAHLDEALLIFGPDTEAPTAPEEDPDSADRSVARVDSGNQTQHALLYARYLGQVQSRIDRAWTKPRTPIGATNFSCRAAILQDRHGTPIDIRLQACNGSQAWRQSLTSAIRTASPLPAPPDASVYADRLVLTFTSDPYVPGGSTEGFEPVRRTATIATATPTDYQSFEHFAQGRDATLTGIARSQSTVIHLTITGDVVSVTESSESASVPGAAAQASEKSK
jgi:TonB C terminal